MERGRGRGKRIRREREAVDKHKGKKALADSNVHGRKRTRADQGKQQPAAPECNQTDRHNDQSPAFDAAARSAWAMLSLDLALSSSP